MKHYKTLLAVSSLAVLFACGDDDGATGQGPDAAATVDANTGPDAQVVPTVGPCGVSWLAGNNQGVATKGVVFSGPDGAFLFFDVTDVDGQASFDSCPSGTMITLISEGGEGVLEEYVELYTVAGILPGDTLLINGGDEGGGGNPFVAYIDVTVSSTNAPSPPSASASAAAGYFYDTYYANGCGGSYSGADPGANFVHSISQNCLGPTGLIDVLVSARIPDYGDYVAFSSKTSVDPALADDDDYITFTTDPWVPASSLAVTVNNALGLAEYVNYYFSFLRGGRSYASTNWGEEPSTFFEDGVHMRNVGAPPAGFSDGFIATMSTYFDDGGSYLSDYSSSVPPAWSIDQKAAMLPRLAGVVLDTTDRTRPKLVWQTDGMLSALLGVFHFNFMTYNPNIFVSWHVLTPAHSGATEFRLPALPDAVSELIPGDDTVFHYEGQPGGMFKDYSWRDYGTMVNDGTLVDDLSYSTFVDDAPAGGRVRVTTYDFYY